MGPDSKRGQWTPTYKLAVIIVAVVVILILLVLYAGFRDSGISAVDKEACRQSIRLNAYTKLRTRTGTDLGTYIVDRYGNRVDLQCSTEYLKVTTSDPDRMKKQIADTMVDCWQMYGEGNLEVFDTRDGNYCAVCARLEFEEGEQLAGFTRFLMDSQAPQQDKTYLQYFQAAGQRCDASAMAPAQFKESYENSQLTDMDTLDTSEPLAVMFVLTKNAYPDGVFETGKLEAAMTAAGPAALVGGVAGVIAGIALCSSGIGCVAGGPLILTIISGATLSAGAGATGGIVLGGAAAATGYALGAACTADYDAYVMLWPYENLSALNCTYLESEATPLAVRYI